MSEAEANPETGFYGYDEDDDDYDLEPLLVVVGDIGSLSFFERTEALWDSLKSVSDGRRSAEADGLLQKLHEEFAWVQGRLGEMQSDFDGVADYFDEVIEALGPGDAPPPVV